MAKRKIASATQLGPRRAKCWRGRGSGGTEREERTETDKEQRGARQVNPLPGPLRPAGELARTTCPHAHSDTYTYTHTHHAGSGDAYAATLAALSRPYCHGSASCGTAGAASLILPTSPDARAIRLKIARFGPVEVNGNALREPDAGVVAARGRHVAGDPVGHPSGAWPDGAPVGLQYYWCDRQPWAAHACAVPWKDLVWSSSTPSSSSPGEEPPCAALMQSFRPGAPALLEGAARASHGRGSRAPAARALSRRRPSGRSPLGRRSGGAPALRRRSSSGASRAPLARRSEHSPRSAASGRGAQPATARGGPEVGGALSRFEAPVGPPACRAKRSTVCATASPEVPTASPARCLALGRAHTSGGVGSHPNAEGCPKESEKRGPATSLAASGLKQLTTRAGSVSPTPRCLAEPGGPELTEVRVDKGCTRSPARRCPNSPRAGQGARFGLSRRKLAEVGPRLAEIWPTQRPTSAKRCAESGAGTTCPNPTAQQTSLIHSAGTHVPSHVQIPGHPSRRRPNALPTDLEHCAEPLHNKTRALGGICRNMRFRHTLCGHNKPKGDSSAPGRAVSLF